MKKIVWALALCFTCFALSGLAKADLIIGGMVDGTQSGGIPKAMKLEATAEIADLSDFWILRDTNGSSDGTFEQSDQFQLPSISLAAGDVFIIYGNSASEAIATGLGQVLPGVVDSILNQNGDDIFAISTTDTVSGVIDAFGLLGQGDTDFYTDSIALRNDPSPNATGVLDGGNFVISGYTDEAFAANFVAIPEPSSLLLIGLAGLGLCTGRRRS